MMMCVLDIPVKDLPTGVDHWRTGAIAPRPGDARGELSRRVIVN